MSSNPRKISTLLFGLFNLTATCVYGQVSLPSNNPLTTYTGQNVFDRLNSNLGTLNCDDNSANYWLKTYSKNSNGFSNHLKSTLPLLDYVSREVEKLNLPAEYAFVPFIESHYNPAAKSKNGPAGLWQMISNTAKHNGVKITAQYDGRYSPVDSTLAALNYLANLTREFSDWQTTLMAYNAGRTRMRTTMSQQGLKSAHAKNKLPKGLALHTYAYVLKVKAIACLIAEPDRYGIKLPNTFEFTPLEVVMLGKQYNNLSDIVKSRNIPLQEIFAINPSYRGLNNNSKSPGQILVPIINIKYQESQYDSGN